jgi:regulator of sigma E protease
VSLPGIFDFLIPFVLLLGVLIFIHELGHFAVAKWLGVKVEKFSIGFGPSLFTRTVGETGIRGRGPAARRLREDAGRDPGRDDGARRARPRLQPPARLAAHRDRAGGAGHEPGAAGVPDRRDPDGRRSTITSRIGGVLPGSVAERGPARGRRVSVPAASRCGAGGSRARLRARRRALVLEVERDGPRAHRELVREPDADGAFGASGLSWHAPVARVGVSDPASPAAQAGIRTGDRIGSLAGQPVANFHALERLLPTLSAPLEIELVRPLDGETEIVRTTLHELPGPPPSSASLGLLPVGVRIAAVEPTAPRSAPASSPATWCCP